MIIAVILGLMYWGFQRFQVLSPQAPALAAWTLVFYFFAATATMAAAHLRFPAVIEIAPDELDAVHDAKLKGRPKQVEDFTRIHPDGELAPFGLVERRGCVAP